MIGCVRYDDAPIKYSGDWAGAVMSEVFSLSPSGSCVALGLLNNATSASTVVPSTAFVTQGLSNTLYFDSIYLVAFLGAAMLVSTEFALRHRGLGGIDG